MKNLVRTTAFIFSFFTISLSCTKEIDFKTEVEFSVIEQHKASGYIDENLSTTITVVPEEILEEFSYSYSYSVSNGKGHFRDRAGEIYPQNEYIALNPLSATMMYVGLESGDHIVKITATDNYGFTEEVEIDYSIAETPPVVWTAMSPVKRIELGNSTQITVNFEKSDAKTEVNYERRYRILEGSGVLSVLSAETADDLSVFQPILPGTYTLNFTPQERGTMKLSFDLNGDDGEEFRAELSFEVLEEIVDTVSPEIILLGENPLIIEMGSTYVDFGAKATDDVDGDISENITIDASDVITSNVGVYQVTFNVSDSSGNAANEVTRTVEVITGENPQNSENDILAFAIPGQEQTAIIDATGHTVTINVPFGTNLNVAPIALSVSQDANVSPSQNVEQNFANPITYVVTAENGNGQEWTVTVNVAASTEKDITNFKIEGINGTFNGTDISFILPSGNDESSLSSTITHTGESINPNSGVSLDFTAPVSFTVTAEDGTQKTYSVSVTVLGDAPTAIASADPMLASLNQDINFTGSTSTDDIGIVSNTWDFGDGNSSTSGNPVHSYTIHGTYTVTLTVMDDGGLTDFVSLEIEVPNQAPSAVASADTLEVDTDVTVNFTGSNSTDDAGVTTYLWNFGDGNTSNAPDPIHSYASAGNYLVTLTVTDGGGLSDAANLNMIVNIPNRAPIAVASSDKTSGPNILTVNFDGSGSSDIDGDSITYNWNFGDGSTSTQMNPTHDFTVSGTYNVELTVSDGEFSVTDNITIIVHVFNRLTGRYSAPAGSLMEVYIRYDGPGDKGSSTVKVHSGSGRSGVQLINLNISWNSPGSADITDEDSFTMPPSGFVYFYGRQNDIIGTSETEYVIKENGSYDYGGFLSVINPIQ